MVTFSVAVGHSRTLPCMVLLFCRLVAAAMGGDVLARPPKRTVRTGVPEATVFTRPAKQFITIGEVQAEEDTRFTQMRALYGIPVDFLKGFDKVDMSEVYRATGGAHANLVMSKDKQHIVKVSTEGDWDSLHSILDDYIEFMTVNKESLLPRFFTAFKLHDERWVVMFNWVRPGFTDYQRLYDLKGTTCSITPGDRLVPVPLVHDKIPTLKDLNFVQNEEKIHLPKATADKLLLQITKDTEFLRNLGLMDYSLIIHVSTVGKCEANSMRRVCPEPPASGLYSTFFQDRNGYAVGVVDKQNMMHIYSLGLIDVLQPYDTLKYWADWYKSIACGGEEERDSVDSIVYQQRFVQYFRRNIVKDARILTSNECETAYRRLSSTISNSTGRLEDSFPAFRRLSQDVDGASCSGLASQSATQAILSEITNGPEKVLTVLCLVAAFIVFAGTFAYLWRRLGKAEAQLKELKPRKTGMVELGNRRHEEFTGGSNGSGDLPRSPRPPEERPSGMVPNMYAPQHGATASYGGSAPYHSDTADSYLAAAAMPANWNQGQAFQSATPHMPPNWGGHSQQPQSVERGTVLQAAW